MSPTYLKLTLHKIQDFMNEPLIITNRNLSETPAGYPEKKHSSGHRPLRGQQKKREETKRLNAVFSLNARQITY